MNTPEQAYARRVLPPTMDMLIDGVEAMTADIVNTWCGRPVVTAKMVADLSRLTQKLKEEVEKLEERLEEIMWEMGG